MTVIAKVLALCIVICAIVYISHKLENWTDKKWQ
jgi:hypothetical protein